MSECLLGLAPACYGIYGEVKVGVALGLSEVNLELRVEIGIITRCGVVARVSDSCSSSNASASAPNAFKCDHTCVRECVVRAEVDRQARGHVCVVPLVYTFICRCERGGG